MKIKLSRNQWESIGFKSGWIKSAQAQQFYIPKNIDINDPSLGKKLEEAFLNGWKARQEYKQGSRMMINPSLKDNLIGRGWLRGWNDAAVGKPQQVPLDLMDYVKSDSEIKIA